MAVNCKSPALCAMMTCIAGMAEVGRLVAHLLHIPRDAVKGGLVLGVAVHCDGAAHMAACRGQPVIVLAVSGR